MTRCTDRVRHAQALRKHARACNVAVVSDTSGRKLVTEMMERIRAASGPTKAKEDAEKEFKLYEQTFQDEAPLPAPPLQAAAVGFRLRGKSFLFTYNWDFFNKALPDGVPALTDAAELWTLWCTAKKRMKKDLDIVKSSSTLEESLLSKLPGRVHLHWKVDRASGHSPPPSPP